MRQHTITRTEQRVLSALNTLDEIDAEQHARDWPEDDPVTGFLRSVDTITRAANVLTYGRRRSSKREVREALERLTGRGLVEKTVCGGMGGETTLYIRKRGER